MATEHTVSETHESQQSTRRLTGLVLFILSAQFMIVMMLAAAMAPDYDFGAGAISDLGVIPETALLFNVSLFLAGALNILGGYLYYRIHGKRWLLAVYTVAGIGAMGAATFPLDTGGIHSLFALIAFVFYNLEAIGTGTRLLGLIRAISVLAGVVGLVYIVLMVIGDAGNTAAFGPINHGGTERMMVYPVMIWMIAFAGYLLGSPDGPTGSSHHGE